jgi:hypothetical protein
MFFKYSTLKLWSAKIQLFLSNKQEPAKLIFITLNSLCFIRICELLIRLFIRFLIILKMFAVLNLFKLQKLFIFRVDV